MRIEVDTAADAAYLYLREIAPGEAVEQVPVEDLEGKIELILDLDRSGHLIGIEIPGGARRLLPPDVHASATHI